MNENRNDKIYDDNNLERKKVGQLFGINYGLHHVQSSGGIKMLFN